MRKLAPAVLAVVLLAGNIAASGWVRGTILWVVFFGGGYWMGKFSLLDGGRDVRR